MKASGNLAVLEREHRLYQSRDTRGGFEMTDVRLH
jgi:hypothetical protein